ncbi:MAG: phenylalanine--tRNA ligase subunit beta [Chloroflexota bacterium]|nr:phenylalanine--tRNA ligase subunit beta [Chloroflexota bacterium]
MRVPLSWLREYVDFDLSPAVLAERLTALGLEVESIERVGADWQSVVVGELLEVAPHPRAERLSLTRVRVAPDRPPLAIVCGATNIAPGQRVPVALPGAVLPGGRTIGVSTIQGSASEGMLCSGAELGLTADADGILILAESNGPLAGGPDGARPPPLGTPLDEVVADVVLDIDVKPNRGDLLSLIGLAREVAAISGGRVRWPEIAVPEAGDATSDHLSVEVEAKELCSRFVGRWVDRLSVGPSPLFVQLRLSAAGMRPVSNVVDASNYVMLELGKPIHTFDAAAVSEGRIIVRRARPGERIETLDHVERVLDPDALLIADPRGPIGIAGVMGGAGSEVSDATTAVVVESAVFDPVSIRRTAQRFALRSEASLRFEKGQESRLARLGADRTAQLICAWAGGRAARGAVDTNPLDEEPRRVGFRPARVSQLLGDDIPAPTMAELLARVEIATEDASADDRVTVIAGVEPMVVPAEAAQALVAVVPPHRRDITIEADVAEEVIRLRGYQSLRPRLPDTPMPPYRVEPRRAINRLRDLLAGRGLAEVVNHALIAPADHAVLGIPAGDQATVRISNPVSADHSELRRSLLPGLVGVLLRNERQRRDEVAIFEVGAVHWFEGGEPRQVEQVGLLLAANWQPPSWAGSPRQADLADVKGVVEWLAARLGGAQVEYRPVKPLPRVEHPGRTAQAVISDQGADHLIGRVGELDPRYLHAYDARAERAVFALLELAPLLALAERRPRVPLLPRLPAIERDVAVIVPRNLPQARVAAVIRMTAGAALAGLVLFDRYEGAPLAPTEVSLGYRLRFQPLERPLGDDEVDAIISSIVAELNAQLAARVRGTDGGG